jgi:hypothetical protein
MHRLVLGLPTVLQVRSTYAILFCEDGVFQFKDLNEETKYSALKVPSGDHSKRIWALINTNPDLLEPAPMFKHSGPFFVVNATSPYSDRLEWLNAVGQDTFYMKSWSLSEIIQAYVDLASGSL